MRREDIERWREGDHRQRAGRFGYCSSLSLSQNFSIFKVSIFFAASLSSHSLWSQAEYLAFYFSFLFYYFVLTIFILSRYSLLLYLSQYTLFLLYYSLIYFYLPLLSCYIFNYFLKCV